MLKNTFYTIKEITDTDNSRNYLVSLNALHPIFQAHFAGNPIMPGACVVQLIKELTSDCFKQDFVTRTIENMKFLYEINPLKTPEISVRLTFSKQDKGDVSEQTAVFVQENDRFSVSTILSVGDLIFSKSTIKFEKKAYQ